MPSSPKRPSPRPAQPVGGAEPLPLEPPYPDEPPPEDTTSPRRPPPAPGAQRAGSKSTGQGARRTSTRRGPYLPGDADAEASVLAALLTRPEVFADVTDQLAPEDFCVLAHQEVYRAIVECDLANKPFDQVTVAAQLRKNRMLERVGGPDGLKDLVAAHTQDTNTSAYAEIIAEKALLRRTHAAAVETLNDATAPEASGDDVLSRAEERFFALGQPRSRSAFKSMAEVMAETIKELSQTRNSLLLGASTGFGELDRMTAGLRPGKLYVVGARPAMGKSAWAAQIAAHVAATESPGLVCFMSYEMDANEIAMRLLAGRLGYSGHRLSQGDLPKEMEGDLTRASAALSQLPITINDRPPMTVSGLASSLRRLARRTPISLVVVDYLQLMSAENNRRNDNRTQEVAEISRGLKILAGQMECPIVALSQLSRSLEARVTKRPMLSDLRESGAIEQDADCVIFLYRSAVYNPTAAPEEAELIVAKNRAGPIGTVHLRWEAERGPRFRDVTPADAPREQAPVPRERLEPPGQRSGFRPRGAAPF